MKVRAMNAVELGADALIDDHVRIATAFIREAQAAEEKGDVNAVADNLRRSVRSLSNARDRSRKHGTQAQRDFVAELAFIVVGALDLVLDRVSDDA